MLDSRLIQAISRTLRLEPSAISPDTTPENTPAWDSVAHLTLILELESEFGVRFPVEEIPVLTSVGRLQEALEQQKVL